LTLDVFLVVLAGALLHASWNLIVKASSDRYLDAVGVVAAAALCCLPIAIILPLPAVASWPWLAASAIIHVLYFALVGASYARSDMSRSYPVMRGVAPLLVTVVSVAFLGQALPVMALLGIGILCSGVLLMVGRNLRSDAGLAFALLNAVAIAAYTLIDGHGVRQTGSALAYTAWLFLLTAPLQLVIALSVCGKRRVLEHASSRWLWLFTGGFASLGAYATALYAAQHAPVAMVAALREVSILFAVLLAAVFLKEKLTAMRALSASTILFGVVFLRLA
jgi:drug/metabolite transporter (DMT)-like permease